MKDVSFKAHNGPVVCLALSQNGNLIATASEKVSLTLIILLGHKNKNFWHSEWLQIIEGAQERYTVLHNYLHLFWPASWMADCLLKQTQDSCV